MTKAVIFPALLLIASYSSYAQGCSDAGICTIGNFNTLHGENTSSMNKYRNEIDISYTYATHLANERFSQPQLNYRYIKKNSAFYELRIPFNIATRKTPSISTYGLGDMIATYNNHFPNKNHIELNYSLGLRVSFSDASTSDSKSLFSYPMFLQSGLGTTDIIAALNYDPYKYLSIGTGIQYPIIQYNTNIINLTNGTDMITGTGFRRKPDALFKLTAHYPAGKVLFNLGALSIFHLHDDYYNTSSGKYYLRGSKGITLNWNAEINYSITERSGVSLLYAEPLKTRPNIPDGLARSKVINIKFTWKW